MILSLGCAGSPASCFCICPGVTPGADGVSASLSTFSVDLISIVHFPFLYASCIAAPNIARSRQAPGTGQHADPHQRSAGIGIRQAERHPLRNER